MADGKVVFKCSSFSLVLHNTNEMSLRRILKFSFLDTLNSQGLFCSFCSKKLVSFVAIGKNRQNFMFRFNPEGIILSVGQYIMSISLMCVGF